MGVQRPPLETLWVDMGLPSGNRWAVSNLDATGPYFFQESPFQYEGSFFSWGNVTPHNPISESEFDYDFGGVNSSAPYYEGQPYGDTPGSLLTGNIPLNSDAARRLLGSPWYMPSSYDFDELLANIIFINADGSEVESDKTDKRVTVNGVLGLYLESKINGARLFLSCSGVGVGRLWYDPGSLGYYWSSTWNSARRARYLSFYGGGVNPQNINDRYCGFSVRPIWNPRDLRG